MLLPAEEEKHGQRWRLLTAGRRRRKRKGKWLTAATREEGGKRMSIGFEGLTKSQFNYKIAIRLY
ncbi:MAG: hypothetical protein Q8835_03155 [Sweet potato little leaf phytoplasma]|nr:hypothetical protein [Sweet potato little leaf phytoplasma]